jgi:tetratricopeptide (TPR) repeat protein
MSHTSRILIAALAALALASAGCGSGQGAAQRLAKAQTLADAGNLDEALIELRNALKEEPKNAEVNFRLAKLLHQREEIPDAVFFYEEALRIDPRHADAALGLAFLMLSDDVDYAQRLVDGVIERDPKNALAWVRRSDIALARGDAEAALSAALTAAELGPESARVQIQAGLVHRARIRKHALLGEPVPDSLYQDALSAFERARDAKDDSADHEIAVMAWVERANTLATWPAREGEAAQAYREAFEAAVKLGGSHDRALDATIAYAQRKQDVALSQWALEKGVEVHPERIDLWRRLARVVDPQDATASPTLARLIAQRPQDADAHSVYARDLAGRGRATDALAHLESVAAKVDAPEVARFAQLEIAVAANDEATAKSAAEHLAKEHPSSRENGLAQAVMLRRAGDYGGAADALARVADAFGTTAGMQARLAELRLQQGDAAAALEAAERGLALASTPKQRLPLLRAQSRAQLARGAFDAAAHTFRRMSEITQGKVATPDLVPYARALYRTDRPDAARALLETALELPEPPLDAIVLFARNEGAKDRARAEALIAKALETHPRNPTLLEEAARFDIAAGRAEQAKQRLGTAIESAPSYAPLHVTLARIRLQTGDAKGAIASAEEALRLDPESPNGMAARVLVAAYNELGRAKEAVAELQRTHAGGKLGLGGQVLLAQLLTVEGRRAEAIAVLEGIVAKTPNQAGPKNDLAYLLVEANQDLDRALSLAQEARAALPSVGSVADTLGYAYLAKNLPEAALPQFEEAVELAAPKSPEWGLAQLHRAQALQALGRAEAAAEAAQAALQADAFVGQQEARALLSRLSQAG